MALNRIEISGSSITLETVKKLSYKWEKEQLSVAEKATLAHFTLGFGNNVELGRAFVQHWDEIMTELKEIIPNPSPQQLLKGLIEVAQLVKFYEEDRSLTAFIHLFSFLAGYQWRHFEKGSDLLVFTSAMDLHRIIGSILLDYLSTSNPGTT